MCVNHILERVTCSQPVLGIVGKGLKLIHPPSVLPCPLGQVMQPRPWSLSHSAQVNPGVWGTSRGLSFIILPKAFGVTFWSKSFDLHLLLKHPEPQRNLFGFCEPAGCRPETGFQFCLDIPLHHPLQIPGKWLLPKGHLLVSIHASSPKRELRMAPYLYERLLTNKDKRIWPDPMGLLEKNKRICPDLIGLTACFVH